MPVSLSDLGCLLLTHVRDTIRLCGLLRQVVPRDSKSLGYPFSRLLKNRSYLSVQSSKMAESNQPYISPKLIV